MSKKRRYEVRSKRAIEHVATLEVEADSFEEARAIAEREADEPRGNHWREGDVLSQDVKVKVVR